MNYDYATLRKMYLCKYWIRNQQNLIMLCSRLRFQVQFPIQKILMKDWKFQFLIENLKFEVWNWNLSVMVPHLKNVVKESAAVCWLMGWRFANNLAPRENVFSLQTISN